MVLGLAGGVGAGWEHLSPGDSGVLFNTVSVTIEMIWKEKYNSIVMHSDNGFYSCDPKGILKLAHGSFFLD